MAVAHIEEGGVHEGVVEVEEGDEELLFVVGDSSEVISDNRVSYEVVC